MKRLFGICSAIIILGLGAISCNKEMSLEEEQAAAEKATEFWEVVGQLVSGDDYTEDYADKTFEPTYGEPETEGSLTRVVYVNDGSVCATVDVEIKQIPHLQKIVYKPSGAGENGSFQGRSDNSLYTSIPAIPGLE